jgi:hypothetical protein
MPGWTFEEQPDPSHAQKLWTGLREQYPYVSEHPPVDFVKEVERWDVIEAQQQPGWTNDKTRRVAYGTNVAGRMPKKKRAGGSSTRGATQNPRKSNQKHPKSSGPSQTWMSPGMKLSDVSASYAFALERPWDSPPAGIPVFPNFPTQKVVSYGKGTFTTGTATGIGFVYVSPYIVTGNDGAGIWYTSGTNHTASAFATSGTGISSTTIPNGPYAGSEITASGVQYRRVGFGVRVSYRGRAIDAGGKMAALEEPYHQALTGKNMADLLSYRTVRTQSGASRKWLGVVYHPLDAQDVEFNTTTTGNAFIGIMCEAASAATPVTFDWEIYAINEFRGLATAASQTHSDADVVGFSAVLDAATNTLGSVGQRMLDASGGLPWKIIYEKIQNEFMNNMTHWGARVTMSAAQRRMASASQAHRLEL